MCPGLLSYLEWTAALPIWPHCLQGCSGMRGTCSRKEVLATWAIFSEGEETQGSFRITDQSPALGVWQNPGGLGFEGSGQPLLFTSFLHLAPRQTCECMSPGTDSMAIAFLSLAMFIKNIE